MSLESPLALRLAVTSVTAVAACVLLTAFVRARLLVVTVRGMSMSPALAPGDRLLCRRIRSGAGLSPGQIVVVRPPSAPGQHSNPLFVKRIAALAGEPLPDGVPDPTGTGTVPAGACVVLGDHPMSDDSRAWGPLGVHTVVATMLRRIATGDAAATRTWLQ